MIENKVIKIIKKNQFDKGWTLFHSYDLNIKKNRMYKTTTASDIVKLITFSDKIDIILSEPCLSSKIVDEIIWANQYANVNLIAKNDDIVNRYPNISFSSMMIDEKINLNYIGVVGKQNGYYLIDEGYKEIDDSIEKVYFHKENLKNDYSFLNNVSKLIVIDSDGKLEKTELIKETQKAEVDCYYFVNASAYTKKIFNFCKLNNVNLCVSSTTKDGIILHLKNDDLRVLSLYNGEFFITYSIDTIFEYIGQEYKCDYCDDVIDTNSIKEKSFSCCNGTIHQLEIKEIKEVKINTHIKLMSDFIEEKFDYSVIDKHNDYSSEAKLVEYQFTLIPPLFDETYEESSLYKTVCSLIESWNMIQVLQTDEIKKMYFDCLKDDFGLIKFLDESITLTKKLNIHKSECNYKDYYHHVKTAIDIYKYYKDSLLDICKKMFNSINKQSSETKFDKFDNEIEGYKLTIADKNNLIEKGIEVLNNKRRVENLTKKIDDLIKLKKHFEQSSTMRNEKNTSEFVQRCISLINGENMKVNNDSIGNIIKPKDETKISKLEFFVDANLLAIKEYIDKAYELLLKLSLDVDIPEDYKVYDKNEERYIIINDLSEYESTKEICNKYNLKCIARR